MKPLSGKELLKLLESQGWQVVRIKGSDHILAKSGNAVRLSVPAHGNHPLRLDFLNIF